MIDCPDRCRMVLHGIVRRNLHRAIRQVWSASDVDRRLPCPAATLLAAPPSRR